MPASGVVERSDEQFTFNGQIFEFMFPSRGGTLAFGSSSPFAPKTTSGERQYQDYDPFSAIAFSDLSGGMGQDKAIDLTRYATSWRADARGGRIVLGPLTTLVGTIGTLHAADDANLCGWINAMTGTDVTTALHINLDQYTRIYAASFVTVVGQTKLDRVWLPIGATFDIGTVTAKLYTDAAGHPDSLLATTTIVAEDLRPEVRWVAAIFPETTVSAPVTYWIALEVPAATPGSLTWWSRLDAVTPNSLYYNGANWIAFEPLVRLATWAQDPNLASAGPLYYVLGAGRDAITRLWAWHGRRLYYLNSSSTPVVATYYDPVTATHVAKDLGAEVGAHCAIWWQGTAHTHPWLWLARGENVDLLKYDGNVAGFSITPATANVTAMSYAAKVVTLTVANTFHVGDHVVVAGVNAGFSVTNIDGTWTLADGTNALQVVFTVTDQPTGTTPQTITAGTVTVASVTALAYTLKTVTLTMANTFVVGDAITVTGVNAGFSVTNVDGTWTAKTGTNATTVVFDVDTQPTGTTPQTITVGNVTQAAWGTLSGKKARAFCVSGNILVRAYDKNKVSGTLDGTFAEVGTPATVGDQQWPIRRLLAWNGALYAGKDDGLYKLTPDTTWPTSGGVTVTRILDLSSTIDPTNFTLMVEHQGDLIFNVGWGLLRLTSGLVLTSIAPDLGLTTPTQERALLKDAYSTLNALYVVSEAPLTGPATLLSYADGHWHAIAASARAGDMARSVLVEGGIYGNVPRVWWSNGLQVAYNQVPTNTQKRWLWEGMDWAEVGYLVLSWVDGNILTIDKDWIAVEVACHNVGEGTANPHVEIWWRDADATPWSQLGADITTNGLTTLAFPVGSWGIKAELQVRLYRGVLNGIYETPHVEAVVIKYLERPPDAKTFTRTYELASRLLWRNETHINLTLAQQVAQLELLRNAKEPLTWYPWWGSSYQVHIVRYSASELDEERRKGTDIGSIIVVVELVAV